MSAGLARRMRDRGVVVRRSIIVTHGVGDELSAIADHLLVLELAVARLGDSDEFTPFTPNALRTVCAELQERVAALAAAPADEEEIP
ncbi:MAG: hypothetical protein KIS78_19080 [Labilithrix sp.]|nr:hypothetical protein [Labilithrix sp.]